MNNTKNILKKVEDLKDLTPNTETNKILKDIYNFIILNKVEINISAEKKEYIRKKTQLAEYNLELFWADKIINSKNPKSELKKYPYFNNYKKLSEIELNNIGVNKFGKILFAGSGPLPLSIILAADKYNCKYYVMDNMSEAANISRELIKKLYLSTTIKVIEENVFNIKNFDYDIIFISASVDKNIKNFNKLIKNIFENNKRVKTAVVRHSVGNRSLFYENIKIEDLDKKPDLSIDPYNEIINSLLIFNKK